MSLLERAGIVPDLLNPADIDETPRTRETPRRLSARLAQEKARSACRMRRRSRRSGRSVYILAADTVVGSAAAILPKAADEEQAANCLWLLSGRSHWVYSSVA